MARMFVLLLAAVLLFPAAGRGQAGTAASSVEPFKLGTFSNGGGPWVGLVLRDTLVVDLGQANAALEKTRAFPRRAMPSDMVGLIADYENGLKGRLYAIVNDLVQSKAIDGTRPAYVRDVMQVRTHAPIPLPRMIMNTAVNFYSHIAEGAPAEQRQQQIAARKANRGVPYMFLKAPSSVIGTGETVVIPHGRTELDWEIELATIIGRTARYVAAPKALDHVFGYTVMLDISDRGGRPPGGFAGVDWFVMKGQDTFGPMGPYIVPKEFYGDPMARLKQTLLVGTDQRQQADASDMIHSVGEVIEYASSLVTLRPGDVIGAGTSGGVAMGRTSLKGESVFLVAGDEITATIEGIGTLRHKVEAAPAPPPGTGSYLPPLSSYRGRGRGGRGN